GRDAFSTLVSSYVQPAVNSNVTVQVVQNAWCVPGQWVFVQGGGVYRVQSTALDGTTVLTNVDSPVQAAPGTTIAPGQISPAGSPGIDGTDGASAFSLTTASFTQPAIGASVVVQMAATSWIEPGVGVFIAGAGYYTAGTPSDTTHCALTLTIPNALAPPTTVVGAGKSIGPSGPFPQATAAGDVLQLDATLQPIFGPLPTALVINSFARVGTTLHRVGDTVTTPAFTATYNQLPDSASIIDNQGNASAPLTTPFASFSYAHSYTKTTVTSVVYTLTATRTPGGTTTRQSSDAWAFDVYHGAAASVTTESDIEGLTHDVLSTTRSIANWLAESTGSLYDWFCIPSSYGTPTFTDVTTNLSVPFDNTGSVSVTNTNGVTTTYNIYRSHFAGIGTAGTINIRVT
ncbi:MAG TPA: hypothetical protein VNN79_02625, partial [Actinomycetota bacterium]|nr:hypothetical protein [Actinomycetota bacterium]